MVLQFGCENCAAALQRSTARYGHSCSGGGSTHTSRLGRQSVFPGPRPSRGGDCRASLLGADGVYGHGLEADVPGVLGSSRRLRLAPTRFRERSGATEFSLGSAVYGVPCCKLAEVLGAKVGISTMQSFEHRLNKATAAFWKLADYLKCRGVPLSARLRVLHARIFPVALYGSAAWTWAQTVMTRLSTWESGIYRLMCFVGRRPADDVPSWRSGTLAWPARPSMSTADFRRCPLSPFGGFMCSCPSPWRDSRPTSSRKPVGQHGQGQRCGRQFCRP